MSRGVGGERARVDVLGVPVSAIDMADALAAIEAWVRDGERRYVCVCTVHGVAECNRSAEVRRAFAGAGMVTPDGMPLVWLARAAGHRRVARVYGPDLMLAELCRSPRLGHRHLFFGGTDGAAAELARRMRAAIPGLDVAGVIEPPVGTLEDLCTPETAAAINRARPDVVWVGVSTPKQDRWMARMRSRLDAPVLIGVGAAFDFHAGRVRQAPRWMRRAGLEWLFRLAMEPRRLWRRYLIGNTWFVGALVLRRLGLHRPQGAGASPYD